MYLQVTIADDATVVAKPVDIIAPGDKIVSAIEIAATGEDIKIGDITFVL